MFNLLGQFGRLLQRPLNHRWLGVLFGGETMRPPWQPIRPIALAQLGMNRPQMGTRQQMLKDFQVEIALDYFYATTAQIGGQRWQRQMGHGRRPVGWEEEHDFHE
jgi:hypothetical protein